MKNSEIENSVYLSALLVPFRDFSLITGIIFALLACLIWGLIFIVPQFMEGFHSLEITLGRYFLYGLVSLLLFCKEHFYGKKRYPRAVWIYALIFSLIGTILYYVNVVLALRFCSPAICALILGAGPIAIAFYGNWREKEIQYRQLAIPSIGILIGLIVLNLPHMNRDSLLGSYTLGLFCALLALAAWSWYVVENARFMRSHPEISANEWSSLVGVATLIWVIILSGILGPFFHDSIQFSSYLSSSFLLGSAVLGILCAWAGTLLWNKACLRLPVTLAGQLTLFETIFGVLYVYLLEQRLPPLMEAIGVGILLLAVLYGIRKTPARIEA